MKHEMTPPLPASAFDADETIPAGGCAASASRLVLNGNVTIEIACNKDEIVRLNQSETTGGRRTIEASTLTITASTVTIIGNLEVVGNIHATGTIMDEMGNANHHSH